MKMFNLLYGIILIMLLPTIVVAEKLNCSMSRYSDAVKGDAVAQHEVGCAYKVGAVGKRPPDVDAITYINKNYKKWKSEAIKWTLKSARQGFAPAQLELHNMYASSSENREQGVKWLMKAVKQDYPKAVYTLGMVKQTEHLMSLINGGEKDRVKIDEYIKLYKRAALRGLLEAQRTLGNMYLDGEEIDPNFNEARSWYVTAARNGAHDDIWLKLGVMYYEGIGGGKDLQQAEYWIRKAASGYRPNSQAQYMLGVLYSKGHGVIKDQVLAHMWLNLAAAKGIKKAMELREQLSLKLTPNQLQEAERLARDWNPEIYSSY